jgi:hypothetical protein
VATLGFSSSSAGTSSVVAVVSVVSLFPQERIAIKLVKIIVVNKNFFIGMILLIDVIIILNN